MAVGYLRRGQQDAAQGANELRAGFFEFPQVPGSERSQQFFSVRGHAEQDAAVIGGIGTAADEALIDGAIDQFDGAVVLEQHAGGNIGDGGVELFRHAPDALHELILLGAEACGFSGH